MCGSHASLRSSVSSHPTYVPAKAVSRSQTRPVEDFSSLSRPFVENNANVE